MNVAHHWFACDGVTLLGHIHHAKPGSGLGLLIVPPFGWEDVCTYRPLRAVAKLMAEAGIPVMRYDLAGTGDSGGAMHDEGVVERWIRSIGAAADQLRAATGVRDVAVLGVRLGAMLALAAAARGAAIQDLILWGGQVNGRGYLRELKAFRNLEVQEYAVDEPVPPQPEPGIEAGGFLIPPGAEEELMKLNLSSVPLMEERRVLLLSRDDMPVDNALKNALEAAGAQWEMLRGIGYGAMNAIPHETEWPRATAVAVREWLLGRPAVEGRPVGGFRGVEREAPGAGVIETALTIDGNFGVLCEPSMAQTAGGWCLLFLNAGAIRRIGPGRMWVETARRWASRGVPSLRLDLADIGDSEGADEPLPVEVLYRESLVEQVQAAMDELERRMGARRFILTGLCAGAFWSFHTAIATERVRSAVLINPRLFFWDPAVDRRRNERRSVNAIAKGAAWKRLIKGEVPVDRLVKAVRGFADRLMNPVPSGTQIPAEALRTAMRRIENHHTRMLWVFTQGEPLLEELDGEKQLPDWVPCVRLKNAGHTFRPLWAQAELGRLLDTEIAAATQTYAVPGDHVSFDPCGISKASYQPQ
jgi:pimeloyl-ACP methyl ester carboxylesterase